MINWLPTHATWTMFWPTDGRLSSWGGLLKVMRENRNQKLNNKLKEFHPHPLALTPLTQPGDFYVNIIYKAESSPFDYNICFRARESANVHSRRSRRCYSYILLLDCALLISFEQYFHPAEENRQTIKVYDNKTSEQDWQVLERRLKQVYGCKHWTRESTVILFFEPCSPPVCNVLHYKPKQLLLCPLTGILSVFGLVCPVS